MDCFYFSSDILLIANWLFYFLSFLLFYTYLLIRKFEKEEEREEEREFKVFSFIWLHIDFYQY